MAHTRPLGTPATLSMTMEGWPHKQVLALDYLKSEAGSWYLIEEAVKVNSKLSVWRWRFHCIRVAEPEDVDPDVVAEFYWKRRGDR